MSNKSQGKGDSANSFTDNVRPMFAAALPAQETIETMVRAGQEAATKQMEQTIASASEHMERASNQAMKAIDEMNALCTDNMQACVTAATSFAKGYEAVAKNMMGMMQNMMEQGLSASRKMTAAKTMRELMDIQTDLMKNGLDQTMSENTRLSEMTMQICNEALEPISERVTATVERMTKIRAA